MKYFLIFLSAVLMSMFFFPFEFTFWRGINTKHMMFLFGGLCLGYDMLLTRQIIFTKELIFSSIIAMVFSLVAYYATDYNNTSDYSYAGYIGSMWVWLLACYGACTGVRVTHGYISVKLIVNYLLLVCAFQCIISLMIDFSPIIKNVVDSIFATGDLIFMEKVKRLYGIGASLDVAGVRFSAVLVMTAVIVSNDKAIRSNSTYIVCYTLAFLCIGVLGNMMARTTSLGFFLGLAYILFASGMFSYFVKNINIKFWRTITVSMIIVSGFATYFYRTNKKVFSLIRFAFEGFFNWIEKGEWETSSTEVLKSMWVYPDNMKTWIIGDGYFNNPFKAGFYMSTDVGYLRFIYYCGLIGLIVFCLFFVYLSIALSNRFYYIRNMFLLLLIVVFINWTKVATDIFLVYAFFLVISQPYFKSYYKKDFDKI